MAIWIWSLVFYTILINASASPSWRQNCDVDIPESERRDCYPWPNSSREKCESRGCLWCEASSNDHPWCFYNDKVCPSVIPEGSRVDCHPESNPTKNSCTSRDCVWCESPTVGVPWCFRDPAIKQGGDTCPADIPENERIDCHPEQGANKETCLARGCYWCSANTPDAPWCFIPRSHGYRMVGSPQDTATGYRVNINRVNTPSWFGKDFQTVTLDVEYQTNSRIRLKFTDTAASRFEVPLDIRGGTEKAPNPLYDVQFVQSPAFGIKVIRKSTQAAIFDTTLGGLVLSDQFLQITTRFPSNNVFGFGEHEHASFRHDVNWKSYGMWSRDHIVQAGANLYGVQPVCMALDKNNQAHGIFFKNANAQDVTLFPAPGLTYRTIGGILDIYIFLGPTPENVVQQYTEAVGRPLMPPYWSLGFQLCRFGYETLDVLKEAVERTRRYNIPHDVQYGDIDYMDRRLDFTYDRINYAGLPEYVKSLQNEGTRFVIILDPGISIGEPQGTYPAFERGNTMDVWIKDEQGQPVKAKVWPDDPVYFPDFTKPATEEWWVQECKDFKKVVDYDGIWIDMNEPANFVSGTFNGCENVPMNKPPYRPRIKDGIDALTLCGGHQQHLGSHYDLHSLYGLSQAYPTLRAARESTGKRSFVISRSTFPGAGKYTHHWLGDNKSLWSNLHYSIIGMMEFNLFGIPYVGADICGFDGDSTFDLCQRWMQLGAFYPFSRNHNGIGHKPQDPGYFGSEVARVSRESLLIRYRFLPYLYTLFHQAHSQGGTVIRPLMHEFVTDRTTHTIDRQFLWGPAFMISPVLEQGSTQVRAYFPSSRWYDYYDGREVGVKGNWMTISAPADYIPLHMRGGYILPTQQPANSTMISRLNPFELVVAFDEASVAMGTLFWDDGESIDTFEKNEYFLGRYDATATSVTGEVIQNGYPAIGTLKMNSIRVLGMPQGPSEVFVNMQSHTDYDYRADTKEFVVNSLDIGMDTDFAITWKY